MPRSYADEYTPLLYTAMEEEFGLWLRTDDQTTMINTLYEARDKAGDESLNEIMLFRVGEDIVFIAKKSTELPDG